MPRIPEAARASPTLADGPGVAVGGTEDDQGRPGDVRPVGRIAFDSVEESPPSPLSPRPPGR